MESFWTIARVGLPGHGRIHQDSRKHAGASEALHCVDEQFNASCQMAAN